MTTGTALPGLQLAGAPRRRLVLAVPRRPAHRGGEGGGPSGSPSWVEAGCRLGPGAVARTPRRTGPTELARRGGARGRHARPACPPAARRPTGRPSRSPAPGPLGRPAATAAGATCVDRHADADAALAKAGVDVQSMLSLLAAGEPDALAPITGRLASKGSPGRRRRGRHRRADRGRAS